MPLIWSDEMLTDITELDDSRRLLVEVYNNLETAKSTSTSYDDLAAMLRRFSSIGRNYLQLEERYFLLYEPFDQDHNARKDAVEEMGRDIISGLINYLDGKAPVDENLLQKLSSWIRHHFADTADIKRGAIIRDSQDNNTNTTQI